MWTYVFVSLKYITRNEIAESYDNSMFNILRNCQTVFHSLQPLLWVLGTMSSVPTGAALFTTVTPAAGWPDPQQVLNNYIG